jgi:hypothetical protein
MLLLVVSAVKPFSLSLMMRPNNLNCLSLASLSSSLIFDSKAGAYPSGALGRLLVLPADIRSVLKGLPETNTLTFLASLSVMKKKVS